MSDPALIEAAARALHKDDGDDLWSELGSGDQKYYIDLARCLLTAVTPLIEAAYVKSRSTIHVAAIRTAALEEAARVADKFTCGLCGMDDSAAREIRALKEQP